MSDDEQEWQMDIVESRRLRSALDLIELLAYLSEPGSPDDQKAGT